MYFIFYNELIGHFNVAQWDLLLLLLNKFQPLEQSTQTVRVVWTCFFDWDTHALHASK
jgi:hypothetical protein